MNSLVIACSDSGIVAELSALQERLGIADAERMLVPGGPLALNRTGAERRVAKECVTMILESRGVRRVVLVSHQDCVAYERSLGGLGFDQQSILERDLRRAKSMLEDDFLGVEVECYVIPWREGADGAGFGRAERVS
jgi:hypothetical protein